MRIGAISGYGSISGNYRIGSIYGNPKRMDLVERIGNEEYSGNPLAIINKTDDKEEQLIKDIQNKPFDYEAAFMRAKQGLKTEYAGDSKVSMADEMARMMQGVAVNFDSIPVAN